MQTQPQQQRQPAQPENAPSAPSTENKVQAWTEKYNVTMDAEFVPFSLSRNAGEKHPSLNWKITLKKDGKEFLRFDYMQGSGHAPADKLFKRYTSDHVNAVRRECETGKVVTRYTLNHDISFKRIPKPSIVEVLACIAIDASAIDSPTYEEWASELGYDYDSRKGEAIYKTCVEYGLKLRAAVGDKGLQQLRDAAQDW